MGDGYCRAIARSFRADGVSCIRGAQLLRWGGSFQEEHDWGGILIADQGRCFVCRDPILDRT
jgi:hypothetical protein